MKIKKNMQDHIDVFNRELKSFAACNPAVVFNEVVNTEEDYTQGSLTFDNFTVLFRCHGGGSGYSFMEIPIFDDGRSAPLGCVEATYEALFKFNFSQILFSIYDIHNAINDSNFRTLCFHNIITEEDAVDAISEILDFITKNEGIIKQISNDTQLQKTLLDNYFADEKVIDDKFDINEFNKDIESNTEIHNIVLGIHMAIQDGIYKFLLTGNYKQLVKEFNKAEKKNDLIVFEQRYQKFLYDNNFPKPDNTIIQKLKEGDKNTTFTKIFNGGIVLLGFIIGITLSEIISTVLVDTLYKNDLFLGYTSSGILSMVFIIGALLIIISTAYKLPFKFIKNKVSRMFKKEYDKPVLITGLVLLAVGLALIVNTFISNAVFIRDKVLYVDNEPVNESTEVEFIYIQGYEEFENEETVYHHSIEDRDLMYVFNNDYEAYQYCQLYSTDFTVTNDVLKQLNDTDCKVSTYKTLEEYAEKNGFEIEE